MTGTAKVKPPKNNAEWARNTEKRLNSAEHPTSMRVGAWTISTHPDTGALIASNVNGGSLILAEPPAPSDTADPDAITTDVAQVTMTRTALQAIPAGGALVQWDGSLSEIGQWTSGGSGTQVVEAITVPISGVYQLSSTVHWEVGSIAATIGIRVDGVTVIAGRYVESSGIVWPSSIAVGELPLEAGSSISVIALPGAARNIGASTLGTPAIPSTLSLHLIARG
ncbi:hypothetical protein [Nocardia testacea]|uniref:hypothetical protein n=1 Tax=Nocardia testacea TaxID=248551 RepID=UPI0012F7041E|nr:hypothetical protein [Nocardia testacea]